MLYVPSPEYADMPFDQWLNTPEGRRQRAAREQMDFDPASPRGKRSEPRTPPPGWTGTREELEQMGFGMDAQGRPAGMRPAAPSKPKTVNGRVTYPPSSRRPGAARQPASRPAPLVSPGVQMAPPRVPPIGSPGFGGPPGMHQQVPPPFIQGPFIPGIGYQPVPNPAYGEAMGLEWDGQKWVKKDPMADLEREAAELALQQKRLELEQAKNRPAGGPDLRDLMAEARQAMKDQRQQRAYAEQLAREMSDEEIASSGRPWRWDGNQMQYTDTPEEKRRLERNRAQASRQQGDANRRREQATIQQLKNRREMGLRRFTSGQAQSIPPQDMGTPYGDGSFAGPAKFDEQRYRRQEEQYWSQQEGGMEALIERRRQAAEMRSQALQRLQGQKTT